jgi:transcriptional regulator with XRE-family HTH domain
MKANNLNQGDVAKKLGVSNAYVSQILNGNFNFTLKKLIELGCYNRTSVCIKIERFSLH